MDRMLHGVSDAFLKIIRVMENLPGWKSCSG